MHETLNHFAHRTCPSWFLQHLIWILRRDGDTHEYRRHLGCGKVLQTDLLPMLMHQTDETEMADVLLRLLVNLTNPTLLLYREELPKDGPNRRNYLQLVEILQGYKSAFSLQPVWAALEKRFQKVLNIVSKRKMKIRHYYRWIMICEGESAHKGHTI